MPEAIRKPNQLVGWAQRFWDVLIVAGLPNPSVNIRRKDWDKNLTSLTTGKLSAEKLPPIASSRKGHPYARPSFEILPNLIISRG
jgi:hypothetical protein